jgi:hypothetical protein
VWGQWLHRDKVLGKFKLTYAGKPSLFEGKTSFPEGFFEATLQVLAADRAGNFGQHALTYNKTP